MLPDILGVFVVPDGVPHGDLIRVMAQPYEISDQLSEFIISARSEKFPSSTDPVVLNSSITS